MGTVAGKVVAIKKLKYFPDEQPSEGLMQEIRIVSSVIHKNLVKLIGYCTEGANVLLVFEYFPEKSLNFRLHGNKSLVWKARMKIAKGSAEGLAYLHDGCKPKIIHRDVTSTNILLDNNLEAKVADFGLSLFFPETSNLTHISRSNKGTEVYADPDPKNYPSQKVSEKSDVYSYGVVLLELITGRKIKLEGVDIVTWAKPRIEHALRSGDYSNLLDSKLQENYVEEELRIMISCAAACLYKPSKSRPLMKQIVRALESCKDIKDIWDEKNDNKFLQNDPMPNGTHNVNEFRHMVPKPLVISEANNGIESREFTQQELKIATNGLHNTSNGTEMFKAYSQDSYELRNFSYQVLTEATRGFSEDNRLDEGPLGQVYEGTLNGEKVTIKKFNNSRKQEEEYKKMKVTGSDVHHRNLVNLIGYCEEGANRLLVYNPMSNRAHNVDEFRRMVLEPLVISEANIGTEFETSGSSNITNGIQRSQDYFKDTFVLRTFTYQELIMATEGFSEDNCLGEGPLGQVYKGTLNGGKVTIKQFNNPRKQEEEYKKMKAIGSNVHHRNLVNLIGCCEEGANRLLVYEFVQQDKSLGYYLFDESSNLNWSTKYKICVDAVEIVNDLLRSDKCRWKSNQDWMDNFFLDDDFQPKYAEYGREKFLSDFAATHTSTRPFPNLEELSPEAIMILLARD